MPIALALYQPDIPQNAGTLIRLAACMATDIHVIHPTGFAFSEAKFRRAGMDYVAEARLTEHASFERFEAWRRETGKRLVLLTTKATRSAYDTEFTGEDVLMLGRESAGVPEEVAEAADLRIRIPMAPGLRSLNVAVAGAMILGEALRQMGGLPSLETARSEAGNPAAEM